MKKEQKIERYFRIFTQLEKLCEKTSDPIARMSTIIAVLHNKFAHYFWTGFYILNEDVLSVGPYQGSVACLVLEKDKGVCWTCINEQKTIIVPDVHKFPGHIACDGRSRSEIVVPVYDKQKNIAAVFDVDSRSLDSFDEIDKEGLEKIADLIY